MKKFEVTNVETGEIVLEMAIEGKNLDVLFQSILDGYCDKGSKIVPSNDIPNLFISSCGKIMIEELIELDRL